MPFKVKNSVWHMKYTAKYVEEKLNEYWVKKHNCKIVEQYTGCNIGACTLHPEFFNSVLDQCNDKLVCLQQCYREDDGFSPYKTKSDFFYQYQVLVNEGFYNSGVDEIRESIESIDKDFFLNNHMDIVEDTWSHESIGAYGKGYEVRINGLEVLQVTWITHMGGVRIQYPSLEITYGFDRLCMILQDLDSIYDIKYDEDSYLQEKYNYLIHIPNQEELEREETPYEKAISRNDNILMRTIVSRIAVEHMGINLNSLSCEDPLLNPDIFNNPDEMQSILFVVPAENIHTRDECILRYIMKGVFKNVNNLASRILSDGSLQIEIFIDKCVIISSNLERKLINTFTETMIKFKYAERDSFDALELDTCNVEHSLTNIYFDSPIRNELDNRELTLRLINNYCEENDIEQNSLYIELVKKGLSNINFDSRYYDKQIKDIASIYNYSLDFTLTTIDFKHQPIFLIGSDILNELGDDVKKDIMRKVIRDPIRMKILSNINKIKKENKYNLINDLSVYIVQEIKCPLLLSQIYSMHKLSKRLMPKYNELFADNQIDYNKISIDDIFSMSFTSKPLPPCKPLSEYSEKDKESLKEFGELYKTRSYVLGFDDIMPDIIREFKKDL